MSMQKNIIDKAFPEALKILSDLNQELSTSFIFATHDEKIMAYLRRIIHLGDGEITKDEIIDNPKAHD